MLIGCVIGIMIGNNEWGVGSGRKLGWDSFSRVAAAPALTADTIITRLFLECHIDINFTWSN